MAYRLKHGVWPFSTGHERPRRPSPFPTDGKHGSSQTTDASRAERPGPASPGGDRVNLGTSDGTEVGLDATRTGETAFPLGGEEVNGHGGGEGLSHDPSVLPGAGGASPATDGSELKGFGE